MNLDSCKNVHDLVILNDTLHSLLISPQLLPQLLKQGFSIPSITSIRSWIKARGWPFTLAVFFFYHIHIILLCPAVMHSVVPPGWSCSGDVAGPLFGFHRGQGFRLASYELLRVVCPADLMDPGSGGVDPTVAHPAAGCETLGTDVFLVPRFQFGSKGIICSPAQRLRLLLKGTRQDNL